MARDIFHPIVREALEKDGWVITHDPYHLLVMDRKYAIDLGVGQLFAAQSRSTKIAIEVKSFVATSLNYEFHGVLGQYLIYQAFLELVEPDRKLYLSVPKPVYDSFFQEEATQYIVSKFNLSLVILNPETKTIDQWIPALSSTQQL